MYVYILWSKPLKQFYVGQTKVLEKRLDRHNSGRVSSTKRGMPWQLIHTEKVKDRSEAMLLERKIKRRGAGRFLEYIKTKI